MELPASELIYWQAFYSIYPLPQHRNDLRVAGILAMIANGFMSLRKLFTRRSFEPVSPSYFMPDWLKGRDRRESLPSLAEQRAQFAAFVAQYKAATGQS